MKEWLLVILGEAVVSVLSYYFLRPSDEEEWIIEFVVNTDTDSISKKFMYKAKNKLTDSNKEDFTNLLFEYIKKNNWHKSYGDIKDYEFYFNELEEL